MAGTWGLAQVNVTGHLSVGSVLEGTTGGQSLGKSPFHDAVAGLWPLPPTNSVKNRAERCDSASRTEPWSREQGGPSVSGFSESLCTSSALRNHRGVQNWLLLRP